MGRQFITSLQDAAIYEQFPQRNTGFDEILELGKSRGASGSIRVLVQFDVSKFTAPIGSEFFLNLRIANAERFQRNQAVELYAVSESWDEGTGVFAQDLRNPQDGATWLSRDASANWGSQDPPFSASLGGSTGSLVTTHSFDWKPTDVRLDVTTVVREWIASGSFSGSTNNGLLIKIPSADETSSVVNTNLRFFSRNTHTIYPPTLEAMWNTQTMSVAPSCGLAAAPEEIEIAVQNMRPEMITGSVHRIRFGVRGANILRNFRTAASRFKPGFFLPSGSHIGIQDAATKAFIVPFDTGSFLSADNTGSYFDLKIENMYINRTYKILVRTTKPWGAEVIDTGHTFRVV